MSPRRRGTAPGAGAPPNWAERLDDPDEPLFTVGVACDLLGIDPQTLRRLGTALEQTHARPSGNQRRYSRNEIALMARACELVRAGVQPSALTRVLRLEQELAAQRTGRRR